MTGRPSRSFKEAEARASESPRSARKDAGRAESPSKRPRHVPRNHRFLTGSIFNVGSPFKEAEARASESPFFLCSASREDSPFKEAEARASESPAAERVEIRKAGTPSKRPRHVPRNHQPRHENQSVGRLPSKRPRHVPRNHQRVSARSERVSEAFKEAEARASESP